MEILASPIKQEKEIEDIHTGKKDVKLFLSADQLQKKSSGIYKKATRIIHELNKIAENKIIVRKPVLL